MRRFYGALGAVAVASLIFAVTGCGETVIDGKKTEELLEAELPKATGKKVSSVECPSGVEVKAGSKFSCTVKLQGGETRTATLEIRDDKANISLIGLSGSESSAGGPNE
jgi:hypothetical protein